jgi:hypothetical protein
MKNKRYILLGLFLLLMISLLPADDGDGDGEGEVVIITGTVRLVGSGTLPQLVITGDRVQWYIMEGEDRDKLFDLQQRTVTVEGEETVRQLTFASGRSAGTRRELRNIKIIEVE